MAMYMRSIKVEGDIMIYRWEDYLRLGCKGRWKAKETAYGGDFGDLDCDHNIWPEDHSCNWNDDLDAANPENSGKSNMFKFLNKK